MGEPRVGIVSGNCRGCGMAEARIKALEEELAEWKLTVKTLRVTLADGRDARIMSEGVFRADTNARIDEIEEQKADLCRQLRRALAGEVDGG